MEVLIVDCNLCNDETFTVFDLSSFVMLKLFEVGDECFENVNEVKLIGLHALQRVVIGEKSFMKNKNDWPRIVDPNRHFYLKDCQQLKELKMGCQSFMDYSVCEIENVPSLEVIEMDYCNFEYASLELKSAGDEMK